MKLPNCNIAWTQVVLASIDLHGLAQAAFALRLLSLLPLFALPAAVQAQFAYATNNGTITITGYTCSGGAVTIPSTIDGLPVTQHRVPGVP